MLSIAIIGGLVMLACGIVMLAGANEAKANRSLKKKNGEPPTAEQVEALVKMLKSAAMTFIILGAILTLFGIRDLIF